MADIWRYRTEIAGLAGGPGLMTNHFSVDLGATNAQDCVDAVAALIAAVDVFTSTSVTYNGANEMEVLDLANGQQTGTIAVTGFVQAGDDSATMLPPINQVLIRWVTDGFFNGRRLQGRTFLPGFCEDSNEPGGVLQGAVASAVTAGARTLIDADVGLCIYSRANFGAALVQDASTWTQFAIQAGRRDG